MFISNIDSGSHRYYVCGKVIGNYLIKSGIPLLSRLEGKMVFSKTQKLQKVLSNMPSFYKVLSKVGVING